MKKSAELLSGPQQDSGGNLEFMAEMESVWEIIFMIML